MQPRDAAHDPFCKYDDPIISLFVSVLFLAGIFGAFLGSWTNAWRGRRPTMLLGGACFFGGAILMAAAVHVAMLVLGRILLGVGVGMCVQCGPLFLSELAPAHLRGMFNVQFQLFITLGILAGQVVNYLTQHAVIGWRLSLGIAAVPAAMLMLGCAFVPETPNSLVRARARVSAGRPAARSDAPALLRHWGASMGGGAAALARGRAAGGAQSVGGRAAPARWRRPS